MAKEGVATRERAPGSSAQNQAPAPVRALVLIWANEDRGHIGEVLLPESDRATFGRDDGSEAGRRLRLVQQRPGKNHPSPPLDNVFLSRRQMALWSKGDRVFVENEEGKAVLRFNDAAVLESRGELRVGDTLEIDRGYLFLCVERLPVLEAGPCTHVFGEADTHGIVGESPDAWELRRQIAEMSDNPHPVLILGPSGSGKELVARALHESSTRRRAKLVACNASTLPPTLIDAELFGNITNYPNVGMAERPGLFGQAEGSTLFLDEIGELPPEQQAHLLRALREREYRPLGAKENRRVGCRCIAATNRDPSELKFDFRARFSQTLHVPGLDSRPEDVPLIARYVLRLIARETAGKYDRFFAGPRREPVLSASLARLLVVRRYTTHVGELTALLWQSLHSSRGNCLELTEAMQREMPGAARQRRPEDVTIEEYLQADRAAAGELKEMAPLLGLKDRHAVSRARKRLGLNDASARRAGPPKPNAPR